ncbi:MAG: excinuclease ABC subunit UvrC [Desulfobacterales bacterium]|nr:excinuclease ABC subunit UvrC [Desulfobacterales bacterium]
MQDAESLIEKISRVTSDPGVYLFKDSSDHILYVGKAKNLKKRLTSYISASSAHDPKVQSLKQKIASIDVITTLSEKEALILEANLIKQHKPRYNIVLKDDKSYACLRIDLSHPYPSLTMTRIRSIQHDGALYFGPYTSGLSLRRTLKLIHQIFKLRTCKDTQMASRTRPCLNFQIKACLGPCCLVVDKAAYRERIQEIILFLKGKSTDLIQKIKRQMVAAADQEEFEKACEFRDKLFAIQSMLEKQNVVIKDFLDRDVFGVVEAKGSRIITVLFVRSGILSGSKHFYFQEAIGDLSEILSTFIIQYYENNPFMPKEILLPMPLDELESLEKRLYAMTSKNVRILWPQRGERARLIDLANQNATAELNERLIINLKARDVLNQLQLHIGMNSYPKRIECIDNSHWMGASAVSGIVVFTDGKPNKSEYRKFNLKSLDNIDDYAAMKEILTRRFSGSLKHETYPDLLIIDGGKGQLHSAVQVLRELNMLDRIDVIAIAKKDEVKGELSDKIFKYGNHEAIDFENKPQLLHFLQNIRDEAHRHVITFHKKKRSNALLYSVLDDIPGIGKKRKLALLKHFGGMTQIKSASVEDIAQVLNTQLAKKVKEILNNHP